MAKKRVPIQDRLETVGVGRGLAAIFEETEPTVAKPPKLATGASEQRATAVVEERHKPTLKRAGFWLDEVTLELLEALWIKQRRRAGGGPSKSDLVRQAIRLLAQQLEK